MTQRSADAMIGQVELSIDHFNRGSLTQGLTGHGSADNSIMFETERIVRLGPDVLTRGNLVKRGERIRLPLELAWKFDPAGKLERIEAYPSSSEAVTPLAATHRTGRRRFSRQELRDMPQRVEHV
ncbi:MAG TPA: hypothetical protein VD766_11220 [Solirubrobacterales bacterium]|nr:hypothetical protein [Solirubrobacterales bacterium]